ncbi:MAG: hypothetical protein WB586_26590 [Chthoniobacterales bacterium]
MIAKRPDSVYESGRRSGAWVKVKLTQAQEFVVGGYTPAQVKFTQWTSDDQLRQPVFLGLRS